MTIINKHPYLTKYNVLAVPVPNREDETGTKAEILFLDRRCGISWPTANRMGYASIWGLEDRRTALGASKPVVLLSEVVDKKSGEGRVSRQIFFERILAACHKYHCEWLFADLGEKWEVIIARFDREVGKLRAKVRLYDCHDWLDVEKVRPVIDELIANRLIEIPRQTILYSEMRTFGPSDIRTQDGLSVEERYPAIMAMGAAVTSFDLYPYHKPAAAGPKIGVKEGYR